MRSVCLWLINSFLVLHSYGQVPSITKSGQTTFTISAVDDQTSVERPTQFAVQAKLARKTFTGKSGPNSQPFAFVLTRTDTITVVATSPGYDEAEDVLVVSCDTCSTYSYVVRLTKPRLADSVFRNLSVNRAFQLDNVYFDQSSYVLRTESYPQLDKLVRTLDGIPALVIEIAGHTDNVGDRRLNQALSENRAKIITNYLTRHGIAANRLRYTGYGSSHPAAPNDSEENKRKNRRVEFVVLAM